MIFSVKSFAIRFTVGMRASQRLLCMRPLRRVKINIISPIRSGQALSGFSKLLIAWRQCLLNMAEKIKDVLLSNVLLDIISQWKYSWAIEAPPLKSVITHVHVD
jgi:hypothetical protein